MDIEDHPFADRVMKTGGPHQFGIDTIGIDLPDLDARRPRRRLHQHPEGSAALPQALGTGKVILPEADEFFDLLARSLALWPQVLPNRSRCQQHHCGQSGKQTSEPLCGSSISSWQNPIVHQPLPMMLAMTDHGDIIGQFTPGSQKGGGCES
jgi:hypothetical protein